MNRIAGVGVALGVAVGVAACDASNASGPPDPSLSAGTPSAFVAEPLTATLNGRRPVTGKLEGSDQYPGLCGEDQGMLIVSTGTGTIAHFGNAVMVSTVCANLTDFSLIGPAPFSIEAADGDEVGGLTTGFEFTDYGFVFYTSITWGTGRFEGASGELAFPTVSTGAGTWSSGVEGWITY